MSALQRHLAKSLVDTKAQLNTTTSDNDHTANTPPNNTTKQATTTPTNHPQPRYCPILLSPSGPVSTAQQIKDLAGLASLPETEELVQIDSDGADRGTVTVCRLTAEELARLEKTVDTRWSGKGNPVALLEGLRVYTIVVVGMKEGALEEGGDGDGEGGITYNIPWRRPVEDSGDESDDDPWAPGVWQQATRDMLAGTFRSREGALFPVLLEEDGFLSTPEHLQYLADLPSVPRVFETDRLDWRSGDKVGSATICTITWDEKRRMDDKVEVRFGLAFRVYVLFEGAKRAPLMVRGPKTADTASETDEFGEGMLEDGEEEEEEQEVGEQGDREERFMEGTGLESGRRKGKGKQVETE